MTIESYEAAGGFRTELTRVRDIGLNLTWLQQEIPTRPHRAPELQALADLRLALDRLRAEIACTRNT